MIEKLYKKLPDDENCHKKIEMVEKVKHSFCRKQGGSSFFETVHISKTKIKVDHDSNLRNKVMGIYTIGKLAICATREGEFEENVHNVQTRQALLHIDEHFPVL